MPTRDGEKMPGVACAAGCRFSPTGFSRVLSDSLGFSRVLSDLGRRGSVGDPPVLNSHARKLCRPHDKQQRKQQGTTAAPKQCEEDGCTAPAHARKLCRPHDKQQRKQQGTIAAPKQ